MRRALAILSVLVHVLQKLCMLLLNYYTPSFYLFLDHDVAGYRVYSWCIVFPSRILVLVRLTVPDYLTQTRLFLSAKAHIIHVRRSETPDKPPPTARLIRLLGYPDEMKRTAHSRASLVTQHLR